MEIEKSDLILFQKDWNSSRKESNGAGKTISKEGEETLQILWRFVTLAEKHFKEHKFTEFYSTELKISKNDLDFLLENYAQKSPKIILEELLKEELLTKLTSTEIRMKELCYKYGFRSRSTFTKFIKTRTGYTPRQYRALKYLNSI